MKNVNQFKGMKILVLGLAKSGYAAAKLFHSAGADVTVNDASPEEGNEEAAALRSERYSCYLRRSSCGYSWMKDLSLL